MSMQEAAAMSIQRADTQLDGGGAWVAYYSDRSAAAVFRTELEALRVAVERSMQVKFVTWGEDIW